MCYVIHCLFYLHSKESCNGGMLRVVNFGRSYLPLRKCPHLTPNLKIVGISNKQIICERLAKEIQTLCNTPHHNFCTTNEKSQKC